MRKATWAKKTVLITGAGQGLGRSLSIKSAELGAKVVVTDRNLSAARETCELITQSGGTAVPFEMDITDYESIVRVREQALESFGPISVLINNAGVVVGGAFEEISLESHLRTIEINLKGLIQVTHIFLPDLLKNLEASLVNISSASAFLALPFASTYAASKWGVLGFSDSLREELRLKKQTQLKILAVCPSYISTGMFEGVRLPWLMNWLTPEILAQRILGAVVRKKEIVLTPWNVLPVPLAKGVLPRSWFLAFCRWLGVSRSMISWRGHSSKSEGFFST